MGFLKGAPDSVQYILNSKLNDYYEEINTDSAVYFAEQELMIARRNKQKLAESDALVSIGYQLVSGGKYGESLKYLLEAFEIAAEAAVHIDEFELGKALNRIILWFADNGNPIAGDWR